MKERKKEKTKKQDKLKMRKIRVLSSQRKKENSRFGLRLSLRFCTQTLENFRLFLTHNLIISLFRNNIFLVKLTLSQNQHFFHISFFAGKQTSEPSKLLERKYFLTLASMWTKLKKVFVWWITDTLTLFMCKGCQTSTAIISPNFFDSMAAKKQVMQSSTAQMGNIRPSF